MRRLRLGGAPSSSCLATQRFRDFGEHSSHRALRQFEDSPARLFSSLTQTRFLDVRQSTLTPLKVSRLQSWSTALAGSPMPACAKYARHSRSLWTAVADNNPFT